MNKKIIWFASDNKIFWSLKKARTLKQAKEKTLLKWELIKRWLTAWDTAETCGFCNIRYCNCCELSPCICDYYNSAITIKFIEERTSHVQIN